MKTFARHSAFWALLSLLLSPLAVAHALAPPADSVPSITEQGQRDHIRPAAKRLSEEEAYSSEDSPEDFLIREPSQALRETFGLTPFYQQWIDVEGIPHFGIRERESIRYEGSSLADSADDEPSPGCATGDGRK